MFSWFLKHNKSKPLVYTVHGQGWNSEKRSSQQTVAKETTK